MYWSGVGGLSGGGFLAWQVAPGAWSHQADDLNWLVAPALVVMVYSVVYLLSTGRLATGRD